MNIIRNTKDARRVYRDILQGYSYLEEENLYVKHFAEEDLGYLETLYKKCEKKLEAMGIESTKAKLDFLKKEDYWTQDEENNYINAKSAVSAISKICGFVMLRNFYFIPSNVNFIQHF